MIFFFWSNKWDFRFKSNRMGKKLMSEFYTEKEKQPTSKRQKYAIQESSTSYFENALTCPPYHTISAPLTHTPLLKLQRSLKTALSRAICAILGVPSVNTQRLPSPTDIPPNSPWRPRGFFSQCFTDILLPHLTGRIFGTAYTSFPLYINLPYSLAPWSLNNCRLLVLAP